MTCQFEVSHAGLACLALEARTQWFGWSVRLLQLWMIGLPDSRPFPAPPNTPPLPKNKGAEEFWDAMLACWHVQHAPGMSQDGYRGNEARGQGDVCSRLLMSVRRVKSTRLVIDRLLSGEGKHLDMFDLPIHYNLCIRIGHDERKERTAWLYPEAGGRVPSGINMAQWHSGTLAWWHGGIAASHHRRLTAGQGSKEARFRDDAFVGSSLCRAHPMHTQWAGSSGGIMQTASVQ